MNLKPIVQAGMTIMIITLLSHCQERKISDRVEENMELAEDSESTEDYLEKDFNILLKDYENPSRGLWHNPDVVVEKLGDLSRSKTRLRPPRLRSESSSGTEAAAAKAVPHRGVKPARRQNRANTVSK